MKVSILVAVAQQGVIGRAGGLPWRLSADLIRFKRITWGHWIVMGRKTFESIGRALPGRTSVVITRQADYSAPEGVLVAGSLDEALRAAAEAAQPEVFVVGGGEIYRQALPRADRIYLTQVEARIEGDTFFPALDAEGWTLVEQSRREADEKNEFPCDYRVYDRAQAAIAPDAADPPRG